MGTLVKRKVKDKEQYIYMHKQLKGMAGECDIYN